MVVLQTHTLLEDLLGDTVVAAEEVVVVDMEAEEGKAFNDIVHS